MAKKQSDRHRKQRERQRLLRERDKAERRPGRDDVARVLLHWFITETERKGFTRERDSAFEVVGRRLAAQGFDAVRTEEVIEALIERYVSEGWVFQRKPHLSPLLHETAFEPPG
jgi:hypothetical protein